ncbi:MAG: COQ9 family protein [Alphaproteobacteria bacterium]|nr:COQ9 family protein [Alphaproteobacteria bacterium]MBM3613337.1 COQ9 family protein [Alphaproteobacteria bacterium]
MSNAFWRPLAPSLERDRLLEAVLNHVPFDGWSPAALKAAAGDLGLTQEEAEREFPGGVLDLIGYHSVRADRQMGEALAALDLAKLSLRRRVIAVIRARLEQNASARESVRAALGVLSQPRNLPVAMALLYRTVDAVWWAAGDTATNFSFYTKRATLAGVYMATLMVWLNDRSEGASETWAFLERRIDDVLKIQKARGRVEAALPDLPGLFRAFRQATAARHRRGVRPDWRADGDAKREPPSSAPES